MERFLAHLMRVSRWVMVPLFFGLTIVLALFVVQFFVEIWRIGVAFAAGTELHLTLAALSLLDIVLMASLVMIVMLSGLQALARSGDAGGELRGASAWIVGVGTIKVRIMSAIVVISAIDLLEVFFDTAHAATGTLPWLIALHLTFIVTAVFLAVIDWLAAHGTADLANTGRSAPASDQRQRLRKVEE
jgi:uncharacterized protein (TIGR00645 family)